MPERDPLEELSAVQSRLLGEADASMRPLPDDIKPGWNGVTAGLRDMDMHANGTASKLERMKNPAYTGHADADGLVRDLRQVAFETREKGLAEVDQHRLAA